MERTGSELIWGKVGWAEPWRQVVVHSETEKLNGVRKGRVPRAQRQ